MIIEIISVIILICVLILLLVFDTNSNITTGNNDIDKQTLKSDKQKDIIESNYITPSEFKIGLVKEKSYKSANNCNNKVLYPINGLGPDYGWKMPDCRCTEFIRSP